MKSMTLTEKGTYKMGDRGKLYVLCFFNDKLVGEFSNIKKAIKHSKNYDCKQK